MFDVDFCAQIGGYPKGSVLLSNDKTKKYTSLIDNNTSNFNVSVDPSKWVQSGLTETEVKTIAWGEGQTSAPWVSQSDLQKQNYISATTTGTAPTYVAAITPTPTLAADLRLRIKFHAATSAASTLNLNALGAKPLKQYDSTGSLVDASIFVNQLTDLEYDGTNWVILDPVPYSSAGAGEVCYFARQTAPTGFIKANGACVLVASYAALTAAIYCGDALNSTSEFGYKCTDSAGLTRSTTGTYIKLPDLRGEFLRGWDDGRGADNYNGARLFGSSQAASTVHNWIGNDTYGGSTQTMRSDVVNMDAKTLFSANSQFANPTAILPDGSTYTQAVRPRNVAMLACIKY